MNNTPQVEMPQYRCHKVVRAAKITAIGYVDAEGKTTVNVVLGDIDGLWITTIEWEEKHKPEPGGYLVEYEDGYRSYSPAKAFEEGYTKIDEPPTGWKPVDMLPTPALCHSDKRWWESPSGEWFCGTCHPTPWLGKGYMHPNDRIKP